MMINAIKACLVSERLADSAVSLGCCDEDTVCELEVQKTKVNELEDKPPLMLNNCMLLHGQTGLLPVIASWSM